MSIFGIFSVVVQSPGLFYAARQEQTIDRGNPYQVVWPLRIGPAHLGYPSEPDIQKGKKTYIPILFLLTSSYVTLGDLTHLSDPQFFYLLNKNLGLGTFILTLKSYDSYILQHMQEKMKSQPLNSYKASSFLQPRELWFYLTVNFLLMVSTWAHLWSYRDADTFPLVVPPSLGPLREGD